MRATSVLRHSPWDGALVALALMHGAALVAWPSMPLIAIGLWWNANTISHNFIHLPFFRDRRLNLVFSWLLTLELGFPHQLWRARHLAHHAGREGASIRMTPRLAAESALVLALWTLLIVTAPRFFVTVYLPGYLIGLALCQLQGHFEHAHGTTSHYGRIYNWLFFRDGLHVEHHAKPAVHWTRLRPSGFGEASATRHSAWPPVLRWLDEVPAALDLLERLVLRSAALQFLVLRSHQPAIARSLVGLSNIKHVVIIGGGLFPRTTIIVRRLLPDAAITIVDRNPKHLESARRFVGGSIRFVEADYTVDHAVGADMVIVPLAFVGDRDVFYRDPPAPLVLVHDWIWRRRGDGRRVAWWLLKRVNVVGQTSRSLHSTSRLTIDGRAA
ncbi:MAG: hypothetical protein EPO35_01600 [Acidobacteria bacterium]|nr:MAG: hypothetical protein EPO35_01600 [Acidobacteriota bacterium]